MFSGFPSACECACEDILSGLPLTASFTLSVAFAVHHGNVCCLECSGIVDWLLRRVYPACLSHEVLVISA